MRITLEFSVPDGADAEAIQATLEQFLLDTQAMLVEEGLMKPEEIIPSVLHFNR
jgi:hypothetical protein